MSKGNNADYTKRVTDALFAPGVGNRADLIREHEHAFRLADLVNRGLVKPDGLTDDGSAKLDALAGAVGVERGEVAAPAGHAKK